MPITYLDGLVAFVALISAGLAMIRGFTREVLSIASWVIAAAGTYFTYEPARFYVEQQIDNPWVWLVVTMAGIFFVLLIIFSYITMRISDWVLKSHIGALDRALGFAFGAARGLLLMVVAFLFFDLFVPDDHKPGWVSEAKSRPMLESLSDRLVGLMPTNPAGDIIDHVKQRIDGGGEEGA